MSYAQYMVDPGWTELVDGTVLGRPVKVWRRRPRNVIELFALSVGRDDHDFLVQNQRRFTYGQFRRAVEAGARALADLGVSAGDRVMIVLYNSPEFWLVQSALWRLGAIPVLGNRWWSAPEFTDAVGRIAPALVVTDVEHPQCLRPAEIAEWWVLSPPNDPVPMPHPDEDDEAVVVFTAGSTGAPKGVVLSHRVLVWTQQTIQVMRGGRPFVAPATPGEQKIALTTTPLFHNGGMVAALGSQMEGGRLVFLTGRFDPAEAVATIARERVSSWSAVPTMFSRLLREPTLTEHDLSSLVAPASGGAAVTDEFVSQLAERLPIATHGLSSGYGMTEMSFLTMASAADLIARPGTVGRLLPGVELRIADPNPDGEGELLARSAGLMIGYFDGDAAPIDDEGWYRTGDLGRIDSDGCVYLTGRVRDQIIRGGENIACVHVESALLAHPDVLEAAVIGVPDEEFGEAVVAIVHPRPGALLDMAALGRHARERLAYFAVPTRWVELDRPLPLLPTGKIDKLVLRTLLATMPSAPASATKGNLI